MVVNDFDPSQDFFEYNKHLKLPFNKFIESWGHSAPQKKSGKKSMLDVLESKKPTLSQVMWAIALYIDYDTIYFNFPDKDRLERSLEDNLLPTDYKLPQELMDVYESLQHDSERRFYRTFCDTIDDINKVIKDTPKTLDNMPDILKALEQFNKILKQKDDYVDRINKKKKDNVRGQKELGALEAGILD